MKPQLTTNNSNYIIQKGEGIFLWGLSGCQNFSAGKKAQSGIYPYQYRSKISNKMAAKRTHPAAHS